MAALHKVAIFGSDSPDDELILLLTPSLASGNFGTPITAALIASGFKVTIITRIESTATFPPGVPVIRTAYTLGDLTTALTGQDAAVCVVGPAGIPHQATMVDAALAAGVKRFIVDDFGWGPNVRSFPEFAEIHALRKVGWDRAAACAKSNHGFTYTGISTGNPIDWAIKKFPVMGFDPAKRSATIYDHGTAKFTGTTLAGIGQSVVGVLRNPAETANRFVKVRSIYTYQNDLLRAFQAATGDGDKWDIQHASIKVVEEDGKRKFKEGAAGWALDLVVAQLFDGQDRCVIAASREESDSDLLGVVEETPEDIVAKVLG